MTRFGVARTRLPFAGTIPTAVRGKTTSGERLRMRFDVVQAASIGGHANSVIVNSVLVKSGVSVTLLLTSRRSNSYEAAARLAGGSFALLAQPCVRLLFGREDAPL